MIEIALSGLVGVVAAASVYLMLSGDLVRFLFGLALMTNAVNLSIFAVGRLRYAAPPLIEQGALAPREAVANALPQALVLTAIVISFGLFVFMLALVYRARGAEMTAPADGAAPEPPATTGTEARG
jgi:multicomponent Na+:H+ antiporter subunit C